MLAVFPSFQLEDQEGGAPHNQQLGLSTLFTTQVEVGPAERKRVVREEGGAEAASRLVHSAAALTCKTKIDPPRLRPWPFCFARAHVGQEHKEREG